MCVSRSITYSLFHLRSVVKHLNSKWARAFHRRARLTESDFQGDVLAVISAFDLTFANGSTMPGISTQTKKFIKDMRKMLVERWALCIYAILLMTGIRPSFTSVTNLRSTALFRCKVELSQALVPIVLARLSNEEPICPQGQHNRSGRKTRR
ncbi:uncharacterized protein LACBIDRAFT_303051 [Laccaria bicolor S238N-H82]|uniref:Predicted protein n=1 Tax=Laccaria bicolor (strain S238N-H82 / ATCC MYA-4686) TaxID=486041 RepID=B0DIU9_LACBS|nr:uncharacterized protein LACBIDRAFT_303051 [Laccaria bicolor S238N-H82]EDR05406.1 predicted protein [Laccaria bicolor S238N-H82]|eukprot:XP_001883964.1 predicted protein [Laccaria bicolor S238N-H82]